MKVLLVDDEVDMQEVSKKHLEQIYGNLTVKTASSGREALELIENNYFAAVVSDYLMPEMNGIEFLEKLRDRGNDIPFIIYTGKGKEDVAMKALNLGADRYVQKGGDPRSEYILLARAIKQSVDHKNAQKELVRSEKEKTAILNSLSESVIHQDEDGRIIWANRAFSDLIGEKINDIVGEFCFDVWFGRKTRCTNCPIVKAYNTGERREAMIKSEVESVWYIRGEPVKNEEGDIVGMLEIASKVLSDGVKKTGFQKLENKFQRLTETSSSIIFILKGYTIVYLNHVMELITGYSEDELKSMNISHLINPEQLEIFMERINYIKNKDGGKTRFELGIKRKDGEIRWIYLTLANLNDGEETSVLCTGVDITEQKYLEDALLYK